MGLQGALGATKCPEAWGARQKASASLFTALSHRYHRHHNRHNHNHRDMCAHALMKQRSFANGWHVQVCCIYVVPQSPEQRSEVQMVL